MRCLKSAVYLLFILALGLSPQAARAAIAFQDGSIAVFYTNKSVINQPFTVTAGASVMVVTLINKGGSGAGVEPATLAWNGQTLIQTTSIDNIASTWRDATIYYLYNPNPGTANITGTANSNGTASDTWVQAYTLSGVDTVLPPITGRKNQNGVTSISLPVSGVPANSWAAAAGLHSNNTGAQSAALTCTDGLGQPSGTVNATADTKDAATMAVMGYVSNLSAGVNTFTFTETGSGGNKEAIVAAVFCLPGPPRIISQSGALRQFVGTTARFSVSCLGLAPTYQWYKGSTPLTDGPTGSGSTISGSTTTNLVISNISAADAASYSLNATDSRGTSATTPASLTVLTPSEAYETAVAAAHPAVFYQLNETTDPSTGSAVAYDNAGGFNGTFGTAAQNGFGGVTGPSVASGFPGFAAANAAAQFTFNTANSNVRLPAWNLNTNIVTITAWVNPAAPQALNTGVVLSRGGSTVAGLVYGAAGNPADNSASLGYIWDNEWETYNWFSGLVPPAGQWSFVALVVTPTNVTIHLMNTNGLASASRSYSHVVQAFNGPGTIGDDTAASNGSRVFNGAIDDVAVFSAALSKSDLVALYTTASGAPANFPPFIAAQPVPLTLYAGQTAQFNVACGGTDPLTYQWQSSTTGTDPFSNVTDGGRIFGATTPVLTIANVATTDAPYYRLRISNSLGATNSDMTTMAVMPVSAAESISSYAFLPGGADWNTLTWASSNNTLSVWSDSLAATNSAAAKPGSTYEILAGGRMRTPQSPRTAVFPGNILTISGSGVWTNNPGTNNTAVGELRLKQPNPGTIIFPRLVMNGGQIDAGSDGNAVVAGRIDIVKNAAFYNDGTSDRGIQIDAWLTGSANIEYHGYNVSSFMSNYVNSLNLTCSSNTFSGQWNVFNGVLLGSGAGSLGTNSITIATNAALQTSYDVISTNATLSLNGRMFLTQNDKFKTVFVGGVPLNVGTYTFAQLNAAYPQFFPATWTPLAGASNSVTGSGSLTVLVQPAPTIATQPASLSKYPTETAQFSVVVQGTPPLYYQWRKGGVSLTDAGNLSGSSTATLTLTNIAAADAGSFDVVITNSLGSVTSVVATLTVLPVGPATTITLATAGTPNVEAGTQDWNTPGMWSDGQPVAVSVLSNPGSTYQVVAGSRLRTPTGAVSTNFPGDVLTVEGDGVFADSGTPTIGEIRFKQSDGSGTVSFKRLVMNGGQLDAGQAGMVIIGGRIDVLANTPIYVDAAAGSDRSYQIDAWLTGNGNIEFRQFGTSFAGNLNITGTSNTYSGTWNVIQGALMGSGPNSLGTNTITVGANGALETTYDIRNPQGSLVLDGQMFLHQNDGFRAVKVGGVDLAPGTYTFAQLNTLYPLNFPATWPRQNGSTVTTGSGSLIVGYTPPPDVKISFTLSGSNLQLNWSQGILLEATNITGPWTTNTANLQLIVLPTEARKFYRVQVQ